jgi:hypothetical protein
MKRSGNKALSTDQRKRQSERLIEAAREAGASEDEADFDEALKRIAKAKPAERSEKKSSKK